MPNLISPFQGVVRNRVGDAVEAATITVYDAVDTDPQSVSNTVASIFSDADGASPINQGTSPVKSDVDGVFIFYAAGGYYHIEVEAEGETRYLENVGIGRADGRDVAAGPGADSSRVLLVGAVGGAAYLEPGLDPLDVPQNQDLGGAAYLEPGLDPLDVPQNQDLGELAYLAESDLQLLEIGDILRTIRPQPTGFVPADGSSYAAGTYPGLEAIPGIVEAYEGQLEDLPGAVNTFTPPAGYDGTQYLLTPIIQISDFTALIVTEDATGGENLLEVDYDSFGGGILGFAGYTNAFGTTRQLSTSESIGVGLPYQAWAAYGFDSFSGFSDFVVAREDDDGSGNLESILYYHDTGTTFLRGGRIELYNQSESNISCAMEYSADGSRLYAAVRVTSAGGDDILRIKGLATTDYSLDFVQDASFVVTDGFHDGIADFKIVNGEFVVLTNQRGLFIISSDFSTIDAYRPNRDVLVGTIDSTAGLVYFAAREFNGAIIDTFDIQARAYLPETPHPDLANLSEVERIYSEKGTLFMSSRYIDGTRKHLWSIFGASALEPITPSELSEVSTDSPFTYGITGEGQPPGEFGIYPIIYNGFSSEFAVYDTFDIGYSSQTGIRVPIVDSDTYETAYIKAE